MKKPIETVLKEISPLPWNLETEPEEKSLHANADYIIHATVHLPKLIEVLKEIHQHHKAYAILEYSPTVLGKLESALESASNVEVGE